MRIVFEIALAFILGVIVLVGPSAIERSSYTHPAAVAPVIAAAVENVSSLTVLLLMLAAAVVAFFARAPVLLIGPAMALVFPIWSCIDMGAGGGGHDLLPVEFAFYFAYIVLATAGAATGRWLARKHLFRAPAPN